MKKIISILSLLLLVTLLITACSSTSSIAATKMDISNTINIGDKLAMNQPTPDDIDYSLERHNLIRRAYWVNGQREKARTLPCPIADVPLGYIVLFEHGNIVGRFIVEGKISSLNSYLTPDSEYYEYSAGEYSTKNRWLPDVDGSYGYNNDGIFFFTPEGKYIEWKGNYLYSDIPFEVEDTVVKVVQINE